MADIRLVTRLNDMHRWVDRAQSDPTWQGARDEAIAAAGSLIAALRAVLDVADTAIPGPCADRVREAISRKLLGEGGGA